MSNVELNMAIPKHKMLNWNKCVDGFKNPREPMSKINMICVRIIQLLRKPIVLLKNVILYLSKNGAHKNLSVYGKVVSDKSPISAKPTSSSLNQIGIS
tara:strand:- start:717 stop:1010 length:294 start_codon:yes stop_codon:yes gene_type:complete